jgi:hypothetical protein
MPASSEYFCLKSLSRSAASSAPRATWSPACKSRRAACGRGGVRANVASRSPVGAAGGPPCPSVAPTLCTYPPTLKARSTCVCARTVPLYTRRLSVGVCATASSLTATGGGAGAARPRQPAGPSRAPTSASTGATGARPGFFRRLVTPEVGS